MAVPELRVRAANGAAPRPDRDFVLYWMIATRRTSWSHALDRAVEWAEQLKKPIVVLEALRVGYEWASDRLHRFVIDGIRENARALAEAGVEHYAYVEPKLDHGKGLLDALAARAAVVVTDDFPCFMLPRMVAAAAERLDVRLEAVDSNGLFPMRAAPRVFPTARGFRSFLAKELPRHLAEPPAAEPFARRRFPRTAPDLRAIEKRWLRADERLLAGDAGAIAKLPIDHAVGAAPFAGGSAEAERTLERFVTKKLARYPDERNEPGVDAASGLSPYLHFGHVSPHRIVARLGGWPGRSAAARAFLDQLVTWRELGFNFCALRDEHDRFESLPDWAQRTLAEHARDERRFVYELDDFAAARTHDPLWNAAQTELAREGRMHNYLRMLWGKKILEWTASPEEALAVMIELNNRFAVDGRDPNSYSGIFWVLGRYDRPWGPERPIYGQVRTMTSENTARKYDVKGYLARYGPEPTLF